MRETGSAVLYFIIDENREYVKIGVSKHPMKRLRDLQAGCPLELKLLLTVECDARDVEERLHHQFAKYWVRREWFKYEGYIKAFVWHASCGHDLPKIGPLRFSEAERREDQGNKISKEDLMTRLRELDLAA